MLEKVDFGAKFDKETYKPLMKSLIDRLIVLQQQAVSEQAGLIVLFEGWNGAGKGSRISDLLYNLDARATSVYVSPDVSEADIQEFAKRKNGVLNYYPLMHEYWSALGERGHITFFDRGWYTKATQAIMARDGAGGLVPQLGQRHYIDSIYDFERQLARDGYTVIKFFVHVSKDAQKKRLERLRADKSTKWRVSDKKLASVKHYDAALKLYDQLLEASNFDFAPWVLVNGEDKRAANLLIAQTMVEALEGALARRAVERARDSVDEYKLAAAAAGAADDADVDVAGKCDAQAPGAGAGEAEGADGAAAGGGEGAAGGDEGVAACPEDGTAAGEGPAPEGGLASGEGSASGEGAAGGEGPASGAAASEGPAAGADSPSPSSAPADAAATPTPAQAVSPTPHAACVLADISPENFAAAERRAQVQHAFAPRGSRFPIVANFPTVDTINHGLRISRDDYKRELKELQERLFKLENLMYQARIPLMIMYEGWDAAGKGGNIKRVAQALDARAYNIFPSPAPTKPELAHPHLWRYWLHLPKAGHVGMYDRSWYGRVLVERVEEITPPARWAQGYDEINEFEHDLIDWGAILLKFWVDVSPAEQLARFEARAADPSKQWKITPDDWRNREKYPQYKAAIDDMFRLTSTTFAPWIVLESDDKLYARVKALRIICDAIETRLKRQ